MKAKPFILFLFIAILTLTFGSFTCSASDLIDPAMYPYTLTAVWYTDTGGSSTYDSSVTYASKYPIVGYYSPNQNSIILVLVDLENHSYKSLKTDSAQYQWYFVSYDYFQTFRDSGKQQLIIDGTNKYLSGGQEYNLCNLTLSNSDKGFYGHISTFTGKIFSDLTALKNYVATGDESGLVKDEDKDRDFSGEYDPNVPYPELFNLSHNGFEVSNASENLELDLIVKSKFFGLKHLKNGISANLDLFDKDTSWTYSSHYYDCTASSEVGYYKSKYDIKNDFDCNNLTDLLADGSHFFTEYPNHNSLPDYSFTSHAANKYAATYGQLALYYNGGSSELGCYPLQMETKYYVRFYQIDYDTGSMSPGRWYCYTVSYSSDKKNVTISPISPDPNGDPIEVNPIPGHEDDGDGGGFIPDIGIDIPTGNPLGMLSSFLDLLTSLPSMLGELSEFLAYAFAFIPESFWSIIYTGVGFSVVFLIFRAIT